MTVSPNLLNCFLAEPLVLDKNNIKLILVAAGTPRPNGQIERLNRDLRPMIAKLAPDLDKWDRVLPEVEFAFNNTFCRAIGNSPAILLFGVHQKGKISDRLGEYIRSFNDYQRDLTQIRTDSSNKISKIQSENKQYYDSRHKRPISTKKVICCPYDHRRYSRTEQETKGR